MPHSRHASSPTRRQFVSTVAGAALGLALPATRFGSPGARAAGTRVLVLGAGLSGLRAALLLEEKGFDVELLEGRARAGGRLWTLADLPGRPEAGGQSLGHSYERMRAMATQVGATLATPLMAHGPKTGNCGACHVQGKVPDRRGGPGSLISVGGRLVKAGDWVDALPGLTDREREIAPDRLLASSLSAGNPLPDSTAWTRPEFAGLDKQSLQDYVATKGASAAAIALMDIAPNSPGIAKASALWGLRDAQRRVAGMAGLPLEFPQGSVGFIDKLQAVLKAKVQTGRVVVGLLTGPDGVVARLADGSTRSADYAICTLPLPALRRVAFDPPLEGLQAAVAREIDYTPITRIYFTVARPFWEQDGQSVTMWTDTVLERIFPIRDDSTAVVSLVAHVDGPNAERLDAMDDEARHRFVEAELARIRPATKGAVHAVRTVSWAKDPLVGGAYVYFQPGQLTRFREPMVRPAGRVHFAGEHTSLTSPGMEGAAESADRAVAELLARLPQG